MSSVPRHGALLTLSQINEVRSFVCVRVFVRRFLFGVVDRDALRLRAQTAAALAKTLATIRLNERARVSVAARRAGDRL